MGLTAKLDDGVSCDGVHEADDDAGRQLKTRRSLPTDSLEHLLTNKSVAKSDPRHTSDFEVGMCAFIYCFGTLQNAGASLYCALQ
jgi:hypothetical protein